MEPCWSAKGSVSVTWEAYLEMQSLRSDPIPAESESQVGLRSVF